jgi:hypothetical protein
VKAVEMTDVVQAVAPPRWSVTVTIPSEPEMVLALVEAVCEPRETLAIGALMDNAPAVSVKVAGVAAPTGTVPAMARTAHTTTALEIHENFRITTQASSRGWPEIPLVPSSRSDSG